MSLDKKRGISLVVLTITIVVTVILATVIVLQSSNTITDALLADFTNQISQIEDQTKTYYYQNNEEPVIGGTSKMDAVELLNMANLDTDTKNTFLKELSDNGDYSATFYQIDLNKLDLDNVQMGLKKEGLNDVYVVAYPSQNVYYVKGIKIDSAVHFTTVKTVQNTEVAALSAESSSEVSVTSTSSKSNIIISRQNNSSWTNMLGIKLQVLINEGEELYLKLPGIVSEKKVNTTNGINNYNIESISALVNIASMTDDELKEFVNFSEDIKILKVIKKKDGVILESADTKLVKNDFVAPVLEEALTIASNEYDNIAYFKVGDSGGSGIKSVKYEYLTKFDENGIVLNYFEGISNLDETYLKQKGKTIAASSNGNVQIKIPKDIASIQMLIEDNAGNVSIFKQSTVQDIFIGATKQSVNSHEAIFKLAVNTTYGVSLLKTYISLDGVNYSNEVDYTARATSNNFQTICGDYIGLSGVRDKVYIKVVVTDNRAIVSNRQTETRIFAFDVQ